MKKKHTWPNYLWQPLLAIIFVVFVLFFMNHFSHSDVLWAVGAGSLSSSCYIIFGHPSSPSAQPKKVIGGYFIGIITGFILRILSMGLHDYNRNFLGTPHFHVIGVIAAISVGLCLFLMSITKLEHPPAAGMALVLVIDMHDYNEIVLVIIAALLLAVIHRLLCRKLVDLFEQ